MKKTLLFIPCFYFVTARAQHITGLACTHSNKKIEVTFNTTPAANFLVLIADSTGHTVFLDNRLNYKGNYKGVLNTNDNKGKYHLKIISDAGHIDKTIMPE